MLQHLIKANIKGGELGKMEQVDRNAAQELQSNVCFFYLRYYEMLWESTFCPFTLTDTGQFIFNINMQFNVNAKFEDMVLKKYIRIYIKHKNMFSVWENKLSVGHSVAQTEVSSLQHHLCPP